MTARIDQLHERVAVNRHGQSPYAAPGERSGAQRDHDGLAALELVEKVAHAAGKAEGKAEMLGEYTLAEVNRAIGTNGAVTVPLHGLQFYTPAEIAGLTTAEPAWIIRGYSALEALTEVDGKVKRSGKTTFVLDGIAAILNRTDWLGQPTMYTKVIVLTEQQRGRS